MLVGAGGLFFCRCVTAQHVVARHDFGVFTVQVRKSHQMGVLGATMRAAKIRLVEREGRIRHHDGGKAQIACGTCAGLDQIVGADADDHKVRDTAPMQPGLDFWTTYICLNVRLEPKFACPYM